MYSFFLIYVAKGILTLDVFIFFAVTVDPSLLTIPKYDFVIWTALISKFEFSPALTALSPILSKYMSDITALVSETSIASFLIFIISKPLITPSPLSTSIASDDIF